MLTKNKRATPYPVNNRLRFLKFGLGVLALIHIWIMIYMWWTAWEVING